MDKEVTQFNSLEKLYKRSLSVYEMSEAKQNLFGFLELLIEIDKEQRKK